MTFHFERRVSESRTCTPAHARVRPSTPSLTDTLTAISDRTVSVGLIDQRNEAVVRVYGAMTDALPHQASLARAVCRLSDTAGLPLSLDDVRGADGQGSQSAQATAVRGLADLRVGSFAGVPVTDDHGQIVGSVCAFGPQPHRWTPTELSALADYAALCANTRRFAASRHTPVAAEVASPERSAPSVGGLLELSHDLAATISTGDVAAAVSRAAVRSLGVERAGVWVIPAHRQRLEFVPDPNAPWSLSDSARVVPLAVDHPVCDVVRRRRMRFVASPAEFAREYPSLAAAADLGRWEAMCLAPLVCGDTAVGCLVLTWTEPHVMTQPECLAIESLRTSAAYAIGRAQLLDQQTQVAATLQQALRPSLPSIDGLTLDARYLPASGQHEVGGDWYDTAPLPDGRVSISIGDVAGHDIRAAAAMGQLRNMQRTLAWAYGTGGPADQVVRLDRAVRDMAPDTIASLIFAHLGTAESDGRRTLTWCNAGHPPPLLVRADGRSAYLDDPMARGCLVGVDATLPRRTQSIELRPGDTVVFYTDGLVERRGRSVDEGLALLRERVAAAASLPALLDAALAPIDAAERDDDVAILAIRVS